MDTLEKQLISICIPTYRRPALLAEALDSCFLQGYSDLEIVIGDDSPDGETAALVAEYKDRYPNRIHYQQHRPSLGQNHNVNDLFARAHGERLLLLHDDDLLTKDAVERLAACWNLIPKLDGAFGKQLLIREDGTPLPQSETDSLNAGYQRIAANAGQIRIPVTAGIQRMFPNDGFMVRTTLARGIGYRSMKEVGHACDTDFGIRLCAAAENIFFVDAFTCKYRVSSQSISKQSIVEPYTYAMLSNLQVPAAANAILGQARRDLAPGAVSGFARLGYSRKAWKVFCSADYPKRLNLRSLYHLALITQSLFLSSKADV